MLPSTKRFSIARRLGEGGMGIVYEAFDEERRVSVALKTLSRVDGEGLARFKREFRALQDLAHPNLVALHELLFEDGRWFFTMELLDGVDFVTYVRGSASEVAYQVTMRGSAARLAAAAPAEDPEEPAARFDEGKLRDALRQLVVGLAALHEMDKVHRDIKPSNVLVTRDGRVVILDFGLVAEASAEDRSTGSDVVGTPTYMAPEQAASLEPTPAADLYAVGVMLFEALTGRLPIEGAPLQVLLAKQSHEPRAPSAFADGVPPNLDALCLKLLSFDPAKRPTAADVMRTIAKEPTPGSTHRGSTEAATFVGRESELSALHAAFEESRGGRLATVLVCGESGIGKSFLVRRFLGEVAAEHAEAILLDGRCYERETVPYKALDGIVDALSRRLSRMPQAEVGSVLPTRSSALAHVFPVLRRIPSIAKERNPVGPQLDPHELRQRAFSALRDLLTRIAVRRPTVVAIDDLQWADEDGLRGLAEVLRTPDAPPLLLVGTVRATPGGTDAQLDRLRAALHTDVRVIDVGCLGAEEALELAARFLRSADAGDVDPAMIAAEARGHPLFVGELARHVALGGAASADVKLDDAIGSRVAGLEPATRELAELVAVAGKPAPQGVIAAAARFELGEFDRRIAMLRASLVVRTGGARRVDEIEPYHDRVREAVLAQLDPGRRRALHEALAIAYEAASSRPDHETLAVHWREAGNASQSATHAEAAGDQAARALAFDRAAQWYEQALELRDDPQAHRRETLVKLGDALANAGRGPLAARSFRKAAEGAPAATSLELRRRSSEQLLRAGLLDEGLDAIRSLLATIGMRLPGTPTMGLIYFLVLRAYLWMRGLEFEARDASEISPKDLERLDICWNISTSLGVIDTFRASAFQARHLVLALRAGEPFRVSRAIAVESVYSSFGGDSVWKRTEVLIARARSLAEGTNRREAVAFALFTSGFAHHLSGHCRTAAELLEDALGRLRECSGMYWEIGTAQNYLLTNLFWLGSLKELGARQPLYLREAIDRGDLYTAFNLRTGPRALAYLVNDDPGLVHREVAAATREWSTKEGFHVEHLDALIATVSAHLYAGDGDRAYAAVTRQWTPLVQSLLPRIQLVRILIHWDRARCAIAVAEADRRAAPSLLARAERDARVLSRERSPMAPPLSKLVEAGVANVRGDGAERVRQLLEAAIAGFGAKNLGLHEVSARRWLGLVVGGDEGKAITRAADAQLAAETVRSPQRFAAMIAPGFGR